MNHVAGAGGSRAAARELLLSAIAGMAALVSHELAHFTVAHAVGAFGITFHWAFVGHDTTSVGDLANAGIALGGPLGSYAIVATCWWMGRRTPAPFTRALGFSAASRSLLLLPYAVRTLLGRDTSTFFFDELRGAQALDWAPAPLVLVTLLVGVGGMAAFGQRARRDRGTLAVISVIVGSFVGVYLWSLLGPLFFPGGSGFN